MKKELFTVFLLTIFFSARAQKKFDSRIIITLSDTSGRYEIVKRALVNCDFIVKDNGNKDTLTTYSRNIGSIQGYTIVNAVISGNTVIISGAFGLNKLDYWGYTTFPNAYDRIIYYKGSKTWKTLTDIANRIPGTISYSK